MASNKSTALRRLEAHNASPGEAGRREKKSRHNTSRRSRSPSNSQDEYSTPSRRSEGGSWTNEKRDEVPSWVKELLAFNKATDRRLKSLEDEVKATGQRISRKRERSPVPDFKYKRNRTQYEFNRRVLEKIETALEASDEEECDQALTEGKSIICERNKHIKLAEKFGWETEDEKRIRRAVKEGKALKGEKKKALKLTKPSATRVFPNDGNRMEQGTRNRIVLKGSGCTSFAKDGNCFRYGRPGHLARFCKNHTGSSSQFKNNL